MRERSVRGTRAVADQATPDALQSKSPSRSQLLGIAFASADVAFEIARDGRVTFALGATTPAHGAEAAVLVGRNWRELFAPEDVDLLDVVLAELLVGQRRGPLRVTTCAPGNAARLAVGDLAVFRMPGGDERVSFTFHRAGLAATASPPAGQPGLLDREAFEALASSLLAEAAAAGVDLQLELLEVAAPHPDADASASPHRRQIAAGLRATAYGGLPGAELTKDRYAILREAGRPPAALRMSEIAGASVRSASAPLAASVAPAQGLRAIRFALERHIASGPDAGASGFTTTLRTTLDRARELEAALDAAQAPLLYQPIADLKTGAVHHYEALVRIGGEPPGDLIALAEELGLIARLDLMVFHGVVAALQAHPHVSIAANLSLHSLREAGFVSRLLDVTAQSPALRSRLLIEVIETGELDDPRAVNDCVQQLRRAGHKVCLDDFGAGAASFDHLRQLDVDVVKIDGKYVRDLGRRSRDRKVLEHMVALCHGLGTVVVAEMIEDAATAAAVADLGVDLGQGWLFGRPAALPPSPCISDAARPASAG